MVDWLNDPPSVGADPIESRPGFAALLNRIEGNGVRVVAWPLKRARDLYGGSPGRWHLHGMSGTPKDRENLDTLDTFIGATPRHL